MEQKDLTMLTKQNNQLNADAEAALMGFVIPITCGDKLRHIIKYCLTTLTLRDNELPSKAYVDEIFNNATEKYNNEKYKTVKYFTVNNSPFGTLFTFVRDNSKLTKRDGSPTSMGSLAWVENIDAPDCSELGYVFFQRVNGKVKRIG